MALANPDIVEASRLLARTLLDLAGIFEDLYVPDDPDEPINQKLHDEIAQVLLAAHARLADYVTRAHEAANTPSITFAVGRADYDKKLN
ncbi:MAG: hypothetical protein AAGJ51_13120 [Pseudomonadota bacterium]